MQLGDTGVRLVIFDFNRTLYDPETEALIPGAMDTLVALQATGVRLALVSRNEANRARILEQLGVREFFTHVEFVSEKDPMVFLSLLRTCNLEPQDVCVVGDYLFDEIRSANGCGMRTVWFKSGRFADLVPQVPNDIPQYIIEQLPQLLDLFS